MSARQPLRPLFMPRISAPTVAEHREARRRALLDAARALLVEGGAGAVRFGAVAERAGLARSSVYEYFADRAALVGAVLDDDFGTWHSAVSEAVGVAGSPLEAVAAFVRVQVRLAGGGAHAVGYALLSSALGDDVRGEVEARHASLADEVAPALREAGVRDVDGAGRLVGAVVAAAVGEVRSGANPAAVAERASAFAVGGVRATVADEPGLHQ